MPGFKLEFDVLKVDSRGLNEKVFADLALEELTLTHARLEQELSGGKNAHGAGLKGYSASYKEYLQSVGRNTSPTDLLLTGEMRRSRQVKKAPGGAEMFFTGSHGTRRPRPRSAGRRIRRGGSGRSISNAQLAQALHERGFTGWHEFGQKDIDRIDKRFADEAIARLEKALQIDKSR